MSKIQDALRKIQSSTSSASRPSVDAPQALQVATVVLEAAATTDVADNYDGRLVTVDRERLREAGLLAPEEQERFIADQYRLIKRPILNLATGIAADRPENANLVMIASALPGDGKTFTAINIALSIALEKDTSVLLVDADVAKPHISELFGMTGEPGLIDVLADKSSKIDRAIIRTDVAGLSLLPAGSQDDHATELLASRRMAQVVDSLSASMPNRVVIFDSPPLLVTSESRVLAGRMGQIALVICAGKTPQHAVVSAIDSLDQDKPVNLILNQAGTSFGDAGYGNYGYGYGDHVSIRQ